MAIIHDTTMSPSKLALLAAWLPAQPWYLDTGRAPELARAGGFRLDDPRGEVGIEFMVVTDGSGERAVAYQVPMTYRGSALPGAGDGLIGTSEHGVLGHRWIYDGTCDPVLTAQLAALIQGDAEPQAQSLSNTPDPTVTSTPVTGGALTVTGTAVVASGPSGTDLQLQTATAGDEHSGQLHSGQLHSGQLHSGQLAVRVHRILRPNGASGPGNGASGPGNGASGPANGAGQPCVSATWQLPDGSRVRGIFATARYAHQPARPA